MQTQLPQNPENRQEGWDQPYRPNIDTARKLFISGLRRVLTPYEHHQDLESMFTTPYIQVSFYSLWSSDEAYDLTKTR